MNEIVLNLFILIKPVTITDVSCCRALVQFSGVRFSSSDKHESQNIKNENSSGYQEIIQRKQVHNFFE